MKRIFVVLLLVVGLGSSLDRAAAQAPSAQLISGTVPISAEVRTALESYLTANPPSSATYYAPMYFKDKGIFAYVSLAALDVAGPNEPWSLETHEGESPKVIWVGTAKVFENGTVQPLYHPAAMLGTPKLAAPASFVPGGGPGIRLPFDFGKSMQYGPRLIHGSGDYGTSGMYAVDLVGGEAMGTNVASRNVWASARSTISVKCVDDLSVAIVTYDTNPGTNDFVYAHLLDNANLEIEQTFEIGQGVGALRYGSFSGDCGWADQGSTMYHIHWMFRPDDRGAFQVNQYTILLDDQKFHTATETIGAGGWIVNLIGPNGDGPPGGENNWGTSVWDNIVTAAISMVNGVASLFPDHNSGAVFIVAAINSIDLMTRLAWVLVRSTLNLAPLALVIAYVIASRSFMAIVWLIFWGIRTFRVIKQAFTPGG